MQKNILILWLGAFGFAIAKHLWKNNPEQIFHASEVNPEIFEAISNSRKHPYFFPWVELPENIKLVGDKYFRPEAWNENIHSLQDADIIISVIPCQFVWWAFKSMKEFLKPWVTILNLSKGIDNQSLETVSEKLAGVLEWIDYSYSYLAGWMIAQELVDEKMLGADIVTQMQEVGEDLKKLFISERLDINLKIWHPKNTELYAALKNIIALILWYYEGKGAWASTLGYYFSKLLGEMRNVILELQADEEIDFTDFALSGDLIATCFGESRNRLLGNMLGKWMSISEALDELKSQKKISEGYETLKGIYTLTKEKKDFEEINSFAEKYL